MLNPKKNTITQNLDNTKMNVGEFVLDAAFNSIKTGRIVNDSFFLSIPEIVQKFDLQDSLFNQIQELVLNSTYYDEVLIGSAIVSVLGLLIAGLQFIITCVRNNNISNVRIVRSGGGNRERFQMVRQGERQN